ncbi:MAG: CHAT domain-containing protein [Deltaproteobacteria bacterium]|nr:CHAT domain-containing protein [Deltaproteobacteria bacterium]
MKEDGSRTSNDLDIDVDVTADSPASVIPRRVGRYEVVREVGRGAMGIVYEARDPLIERKVALKVIRLDLLNGEGDVSLSRKRFFSEAKAAGKLSHPNIVTVYDMFEDSETAYIAMEFIEGDSLSRLSSPERLPVEKVLDITLQICSALECAHEQGIVHRDIKPSNILVTPRGQVKVADFGVARLPTSDMTKSGVMVGTPSYMSPEQVSSKYVDGRSDLFSLGVVLYEQLAGVRPFKGDDVYTTIMKIMHHDPPPILEQRKDLPEDLDQVIRRALAKSPDERYASASRMAEDIARVLQKLSDLEETLSDPAAVSKGAPVRTLIQKRLDIDQELEKLRKDVTVLFGEMTGSSAVFEKLGDLEARVLIQQLHDQLNEIISSHGGKLIKTLGESIMATFPDPVKGAEAAVDIQKKLEKEHPERATLALRIGLHHDRGLIEEGDVYGEVVNTAARIQDLAEPGQILVSERIHRHLQEEGNILTVFEGARIIPGKKEPVDVYRAIWRPEELEADIFRSTGADQQAFWLELTRQGNLIRVTTHEDVPGQTRTLKHVEEISLPPEEIHRFCTRVVELVGRTDRSGRVARSTLKELEGLGRHFYEAFLPKGVRQSLAQTRAKNLVVDVDDQLIQIPWELLHDGQQFLCMRFSMGRVVSTRQEATEGVFQPSGDTMRMVIFSDPKGDLEAAASEGILIEEELHKKAPDLHIIRRTGNVTIPQVRTDLGQFHIVHYAGHADYDLVDPSLGGWMLKDGKLWSRDIASLGGTGQMPGLVFSNACQSGQTEEWRVDPYHSVRIYGLANAFLLAGVRHYIGTFWEVLDRSSSAFAAEFYAQLAEKKSVGESLREARGQYARKHGEESVVWSSYVLYGDPRTRYFGAEERAEAPGVPARLRGFRWKPLAALAAGIGFVVLLTGLLPSLLRQPKNIRPRPAATATGPARPAPDTRVAEAEQPRRERIDRMVQELVRDYREGKTRPLPAPADSWVSSPLTMALIGLEQQGDAPAVAGETRFVALKLSEELGKSQRIQLVERDILDKLLEELKLSTSELADPNTALRIGRLLSARLILTGYVMRMGDEKQIGIRITETETTAVKGAVSRTMGKDAKLVDSAVPLAQEILQRIQLAYPMRGRITSAEGINVELNIGSRVGVTEGMRMMALGSKNKPLGEIEITQVTEKSSTGRITKGTGPFQPGGRVEQIMPEKAGK